MKQVIALPFLAAWAAVSCTSLPQVMKDAADQVQSSSANGGLTDAEVIAGLKEALDKGARQSVAIASMTDGFWKSDRLRIPFPPEAIQVKNTLNDLGMNAQVEQFELTMNRAAEAAAKEAAPVFLNAIKGMSAADGFAILRGGDHAATEYLNEKTTAELTAKFRPIVERSTQQVALANYWSPLASAYNKATLFTGGEQVDPDLDGYITRKAIDGLFLLIADEELKIRQDPLARTSDLLKRVFGAQ